MGRTAGTDALSMVMVMLTLMVMVRPVELRPAWCQQAGNYIAEKTPILTS